MDINYEKNQIIIYGKAIKYDSFIKKLAELSGEQIYGFFSSRPVMLPRKFNCMALTSVLNNKIKFLHSNSLTKDYFQRLQYYKDFTETQLENLFLALNSESIDFYQYKYNLMKLIVDNYEALKLNDGEIRYLKDLPKQKEKNFENYVGYISAASLEQNNTFDGVNIDDLKKDLMFTATNQEIILIGEKYGIEIPERLSKEEYVEFIKYYLAKEDRLTDEAMEVLDDMAFNALSVYCKREGIPMQPTMSKDDLVTYLFYYLEQCEIPYSNISDIKYDKAIYDPLEFSVDLSQISPFGLSDAKKIIHYDGEDLDKEKFDELIDSINNPKIEEEIIEEIVEETKPTKVEIERPLRPGEFKKEEPKENNIIENKVSNNNENIVIIEEEKIKEEPKEKHVPLKDLIGVNVKEKEMNALYAAKKYDKAKKGYFGGIMMTLMITLVIAGAFVGAYFLLR